MDITRWSKSKSLWLFVTPMDYFCVLLLSHVRLFATPLTVTCQAPLSVGFSRQEYWSGLPFPSPGDLPHPGIEPKSPALHVDALLSELLGKTHGLYSPWNSPGQNTGAFPFSRRSSQLRSQTQVSHIARRFFTSWATKGSKNQNHIEYILCSRRWKISIESAKQNWELTVAQIISSLLQNLGLIEESEENH